MDLLIHYTEGTVTLKGLPTQVSQHKIKEAKVKYNEKYAFVIRVSNNIHNIPTLESAELNEEWQEDEKIPVKKDIVKQPAAEQPPKADKPSDASN